MKNIFQSFDFDLIDKQEFKEDSVREELIHPILKELGYSASGKNKIIRSKKLKNPFVKIGSKKRNISQYPDYVLKVGENITWVLDAKAPKENITSGDNLEQIYSYAIHPEIRAKYFALCNGKEFSVFEIDKADPIYHFHLREINKHWNHFSGILSPKSFKGGKYPKNSEPTPEDEFDYVGIIPPKEITDISKQDAKRHFGVHGYFTRQVWKVVQEYILTFTKPGDVVLDPFGGSGITLIESIVTGRKGINIDINPLSIFIINALLSPIKFELLEEGYDRVKNNFIKLRPKSKKDIKKILNKYPYPKGVALPKNADVPTLDKLFTENQLAELALLKGLILKEKRKAVKETLMLMFSGLLNKINLTYHASKGRSEGRGNSGIFAYYRYRVAKSSPQLDVMKVFDSRYSKVLKAKKELRPYIDKWGLSDQKILKGSATKLKGIIDQSVDYIYTDPPYGSKIPYLDLSTMWNSWLDLPVKKKDFELEVIEGGELKKSKTDYAGLLSLSLKEMYRVLKFNRWMSFVFAHKDPSYWHLIVEAAEKEGFEYAGAIKQNNGKVTFKKRQNPFTVLSGQLIINFKKVQNPKSIMKVEIGSDITDLIIENIEGVIAKHDGATIEEINDEIVIKGLELGFLDLLSKKYSDLTPLLRDAFEFSSKDEKYHLPTNSKFKASIPLEVRVKYYLLSYLRRMLHQKIDPNLDDIILAVMPLLKNGKTPENQTILKVLEDVAVRVGKDKWRIQEKKQHFFNF